MELSERQGEVKNQMIKKSTVNNNETLHGSREKVIKLFDNCFGIVSEAKYKTKVLEVLTPKQMLQRLQTALSQVKAGD